MKQMDLLERYLARKKKLKKDIEKSKDIFWNNFLAHRAVLNEFGYIKDDYPTEKGKMTAQIRAENEICIAEKINSQILDNLSAGELSAVICAITTEDLRAEMFCHTPISEGVRKTLNLIKNIKRKIEKVQSNYEVESA